MPSDHSPVTIEEQVKSATDVPSGSTRYDAFISYSRRDKVFADALQKRLEHYSTPSMPGRPSRRLRIFRDTEDLIGADYYHSIEQSLKSSAKLILICSPSSARSEFVNDEVKNFAAIHKSSDIIPVIIGGLPNNEVKPGQEDQAAFPPALCEALALPLAISYQGFDGKKHRPSKAPFEASWYSIIASLLDTSRAEIEQREIRRRRRQLQITVAVSGSIILVLAALTVYAFWQRGIAGENEAKAKQESGRANEESERARIEAAVSMAQKLAQTALVQKETQPDLAALLSVEAAWRVADVGRPDDPEVHNAMLSTSQTNPRLAALLHHQAAVYGLSFSPDRKILATGCADGKVRLWEVATGRLLGEPLTGHTGEVVSVAFSRDGTTLASGSTDKTVRLWDVAGRRPIGGPMQKHTGAVRQVAFSPDGKILASASLEDAKIVFWDLRTQIVLRVKEDLGPVGMGFLPKGNFMAVLTGSGAALLNVQTLETNSEGSNQRPFESGELGVMGLAVSPEGDLLALGVGPGVHLQSISIDGNAPPKFDPENGAWNEFSISHSQQVLGIDLGPGVKCSWCTSGRRRYLASSSQDSTTMIWDLDTGRQVMTFRGHAGPINSVSFSPDGKYLASAGEDGKVGIWDMERPVPSARVLEALGPVGFRPDGGLVTKGAKGSNWYLWNALGERIQDPRNGQGIAPETGDGKPLSAVSPDDKVRVEAIQDKWDSASELQLWSVEPKQAIGPPLKGHTKRIISVAFSPDGKILASGSMDKTIRLWEVSTGQMIGPPLTGFEGAIQSLSFSPDGTVLAAGSGDNQETDENFSTNTEVHAVHLWNIDKRLRMGEPITGFAGWAVQVRFSPDGKSLAAWTAPWLGESSDNVVVIDLGTQALINALCRRANRNLTQEEWKQYIGDHPYRRTCPAFP